MKRIATIVLIVVILAAGAYMLSRRPKEIKRVRPYIKGKIAIVIDDWGNNLNNLGIMEQIRYPLTAAVLPNDKYSKRIAEALRAKGFEVILHLPMEPQENYGLEKDTIMASSSKAQILDILERDLSSLGYPKGVSNHMGSRATSDLRTMGIIFGELKKRKLYFLDSFVISKSVCLELARKMNLACLRRDVFLDNISERGYIRRQIHILKAKARARGFAIGIGHDRKATLEVLKEVMPEISREGYKFVFLSELT